MVGAAGPHTKAVSICADFVQLYAGTPASIVDCPAGTRGLLLEAAGTLNVTMGNGVERDGLPLPAGITPGRFKTIRSGGTASNIWAVL